MNKRTGHEFLGREWPLKRRRMETRTCEGYPFFRYILLKTGKLASWCSLPCFVTSMCSCPAHEVPRDTKGRDVTSNITSSLDISFWYLDPEKKRFSARLSICGEGVERVRRWIRRAGVVPWQPEDLFEPRPCPCFSSSQACLPSNQSLV